MEYKLSYFGMRGRGEVIRMIFSAAGVEFEDERIAREKWPDVKPNCPWKCMPMLTVKDKGVVCQTGAIARYLAKQFGLFGAAPWEELLIDEVQESVQDMIAGAVKWLFEADVIKKAEQKKVYEETMVTKFLEYLRLRLKEGKNGYIVGDKLSLADITVFAFVDGMKNRGNTWFDDVDDVIKHCELVKSNAGIAKWLENRPKE